MKSSFISDSCNHDWAPAATVATGDSEPRAQVRRADIGRSSHSPLGPHGSCSVDRQPRLSRPSEAVQRPLLLVSRRRTHLRHRKRRGLQLKGDQLRAARAC
ncbi:hypothetical protein L596_023557 [Steinernema carpocapsae]|uniref:Uncharacterized protein n=1 Tax=Steinernema carpocapsae TaxID=34508 RepID=A0A4U5ME06_STECR|nr:hypothetical protein L596_023557 [Steinernema carpocapsae]